MQRLLQKISSAFVRCDKLFLALVCYLVALNMPVFVGIACQVHDTLNGYVIFWETYNNLFFHHEFPMWLPYSVYGLPGHIFQLVQLSGADYLVIFCGALLLKIKNVLVMYKLALFLQQLVFLTGVYLLSRRFFKNSAAIFLCCVCACGSIIVREELPFNFADFELLPLVIFFLLRFFDAYKLENIFLALLLVVAAMLASTPYYVVITFLILTVFFAVLAPVYLTRRDRRFKLSGSLKAGILLVSFCFLAYAYHYLIAHMMDHMLILSPGRNQGDSKVPLETFLHYGQHVGAGKFMDLLVPMAVHMFTDVTIYVGLFAVAFAAYALLMVRRAESLAVSAVVIVLGLLSLGGAVSMFFYKVFPGMQYYRHIGYVVGAYKIFLPLLAGFGLDDLLNRKNPRYFQISAILAALVFIAGGFAYCAISSGLQKIFSSCYVILVFVVLAVLFYVYGKDRDKRKLVVYLVMIGACCDLLAYQWLSVAHIYEAAKYKPASYDVVRDWQFRARRSYYSPDSRADELMRYFNICCYVPNYYTPNSVTLYSTAWSIFQWDSPGHFYRSDWVGDCVTKLIALRGGHVSLYLILTPNNDKYLAEVIGANADKLRLVSNVAFASGAEQAQHLASSLPKDSKTTILEDVPLNLQKGWLNQDDPRGCVEVVDFSSNTLKAVADVPQAQGAWLYYADSFHPDWQVYVNGKRSTVFRANVGFKAVKLERGYSSVKFVYKNTRMLAALLTLIIASVVLLLLFFWRLFFMVFPADCLYNNPHEDNSLSPHA